jgi:hypothetical protein
MKKIIILVFIILIFIPPTYAYWSSSVSGNNSVVQGIITIGSWIDPIPPLDTNENYSVGDQFTYDNSVWIVIGSWFNPSQFLNPDGSINFNYVRSYGPVGENTTEWRSYNTYYTGDIVSHNGYNWIVRHEGANNHEPGTNTNAWNRLDPNWFMYNTYEANEIVNYNGQQWRSLTSNRNRIPGQVNWAWELV